MISLQHILVALDFSPTSQVALRHALGIASRFQSRLTVLHVVDSALYGLVGPGGISADVDSVLRECQTLEADLQKEGSLKGLAFNSTVKVGPVWEMINNTIEELASDLLVMGTHGRTGFRKLLLGSVAQNAFRDAPCPVLTVGSHVLRSKDASAPSKHFLVPTDLSSHSFAALPYGLSLAEATGGDITLLRVVSPEQQSQDGLLESARVEEHLQEHEVREDMVRVEVERGGPAEVIVNFADRHGMDMIVMGLRAWAADGPAMWHTAYQVVIKATCPVLSMRAPARSTA